MNARTLIGLVALFAATVANAQLTIPSDGSDGAFAPVADIEVDLGLAADATWDTPGTGNGVYDGDKWAVVFKYTSVSIPAGVTVSFKNHPKHAPVVWLVSGDVTLDGAVTLSGENGTGADRTVSESGPGGFRGGRGGAGSYTSSAGFGPGGAQISSGGSYATEGQGNPDIGGLVSSMYGSDRVVPLIGGSGGSSRNSTDEGGGAGGGAILIAASGTVTVNGTIESNGGSANGYAGCGSGGAIRLIADVVQGTGLLSAVGPTSNYASNGGSGRIRIEANSVVLQDLGVSPTPSLSTPTDPVGLWPETDAPTLKAAQLEYQDAIGGTQFLTVPDDPTASLDFPLTDLSFETDHDVTLHIEATNVPLDWDVTVRVVPLSGQAIEIAAAPLSGDLSFSTTSVTFTMPGGLSAIQVRADAP
jgi:hypothetical protein